MSFLFIIPRRYFKKNLRTFLFFFLHIFFNIDLHTITYVSLITGSIPVKLLSVCDVHKLASL